MEIFERDEATPSYAQTVRFRRLHSEGKLTADNYGKAESQSKRDGQIQLREDRTFLSAQL